MRYDINLRLACWNKKNNGNLVTFLTNTFDYCIFKKTAKHNLRHVIVMKLTFQVLLVEESKLIPTTSWTKANLTDIKPKNYQNHHKNKL